MLLIHFIDTDEFEFTQSTKKKIEGILKESEKKVRELLPRLPKMINIVIATSKDVIPETGETASTHTPYWIEIVVDPDDKRGLDWIVDTQLRGAFFHEAHHCVRMRTIAWDGKPIEKAIFEGVASVFERETTNAEKPWATYDPKTIKNWASDFLKLDPENFNWRQWFFDHPDGRRWVGYRVGAYIVDEAIKKNPGLSAADLAETPSKKILQLASIN